VGGVGSYCQIEKQHHLLDSKLSFLIIFAFTTIVISKELSSRFSSKVEVPTVEVK
jgi:hypothetical protein